MGVVARSAAEPGSGIGLVLGPPFSQAPPEATGPWPTSGAAAAPLPTVARHTVARLEEGAAQPPTVQAWTLPGWLSSVLPQAPAPVAEQAKDLVEGAGHAVSSEASSAPSGAAQDLDDLAQKLYPKLRPYLKKELWLDRERAGMLTR
jgi:hypothetical protein